MPSHPLISSLQNAYALISRTCEYILLLHGKGILYMELKIANQVTLN